MKTSQWKEINSLSQKKTTLCSFCVFLKKWSRSYRQPIFLSCLIGRDATCPVISRIKKDTRRARFRATEPPSGTPDQSPPISFPSEVPLHASTSLVAFSCHNSVSDDWLLLGHVASLYFPSSQLHLYHPVAPVRPLSTNYLDRLISSICFPLFLLTPLLAFSFYCPIETFCSSGNSAEAPPEMRSGVDGFSYPPHLLLMSASFSFSMIGLTSTWIHVYRLQFASMYHLIASLSCYHFHSYNGSKS
jgi:hypothetical protein